MIVIGTYGSTEHPVIRDLRTALGEALDRQQVAIVRAYLDEPVRRRVLDTATPYGVVHKVPAGDVHNLTLCGRKVREGQPRWDNTAHASLDVRQRPACPACVNVMRIDRRWA